LSDVPEILSYSESKSKSESDSSVRERVIVHPEQTSSESDETSNEGATSCVKQDKTPNLGPFTGNPRVKQISHDPKKVSDTTELFFGDSFFELLCKETN
jgi:hypothetical protein